MMPDTIKAKKSAQWFFDALQDVFIGTKVEGESESINRMRVKSRCDTIFAQRRKSAPNKTGQENN